MSERTDRNLCRKVSKSICAGRFLNHQRCGRKYTIVHNKVLLNLVGGFLSFFVPFNLILIEGGKEKDPKRFGMFQLDDFWGSSVGEHFVIVW